MANLITFERALELTSHIPGVQVNRQDFLRSELRRYCTEEQLNCAIEQSPAMAGIPITLLNKIADDCISYETKKVSTLSFAAGIPGGLAMFATIPADGAQFFAHMLRIAQKLSYLYGWKDFNRLDSASKNCMLMFIGVMFGVHEATLFLAQVSERIAANSAQSLAKSAAFPILKQIAAAVGVKLTKDVFGKAVSKAIPILSGFLSGALTYKAFKSMSYRLKDALADQPKLM